MKKKEKSYARISLSTDAWLWYWAIILIDLVDWIPNMSAVIPASCAILFRIAKCFWWIFHFEFFCQIQELNSISLCQPYPVVNLSNWIELQIVLLWLETLSMWANCVFSIWFLCLECSVIHSRLDKMIWLIWWIKAIGERLKENLEERNIWEHRQTIYWRE